MNNGYELRFEFRNKIYSVWVANFPYGYLSTMWVATADGRSTCVSKRLPARVTALEFYEAIDLPSRKKPDIEYVLELTKGERK